MTGEELLDYVRYRVADHGLDNYVHCNRALRVYCQQAGYDWLREVKAAAFQFQADREEYPLGELGLRRISRVWVQDDDSGEWKPLDERRDLSFERSTRRHTNAQGDVNTENIPPGWFEIFGTNQQILRIGPKPGQAYEGRIDGIAATPVIDRLSELPGPAEYHDIVGDIAAGYVLEHEGLVRIKSASDQDGLFIAQALQKQGAGMVQMAMARVPKVLNDSAPSRITSLKPKKIPLMR
jgi:hypothetical protein